MRLLHTSDWHLGQHFMGRNRQAEHAALIDWLLQQVDAQAVDAVLIAGDIFDTGAPPSHARELYSQLIVRLHAAGVALLLLGGNHDSVATLAESRELLACLDTTVVAAVGEPARHVVTLPLRRRPGQAARPGCIACALPFMRPRDLVLSQAGQSAEQKQQALQAAIEACYRSVHGAAIAQRDALAAASGERLPIIATGHLTTVGASRSESVREIYVGSLDAFPTSAFPPADYVALGPEGLQAVTPLPVPCFQPMASVAGSLAALPELMHAAARAGSATRPVWLEVVVEQDDYLPQLTDRVQALADALPVELLRVRRQRGRAAAGMAAAAGESLHEISPAEVFERRLALETLEPAMAQALTRRYQEVVAALDAPDPGASEHDEGARA
jgi:exonuclease SbcD